MSDEEKRAPLEPARFWQLVAVELVTWVLEHDGFCSADDMLSMALNRVETGEAGNPETVCEKSAIALVDEMAGLAAGASVLKEPGEPCKHPDRAPRPCVADFTGLCQWCDERIEGKGVVRDG